MPTYVYVNLPAAGGAFDAAQPLVADWVTTTDEGVVTSMPLVITTGPNATGSTVFSDSSTTGITGLGTSNARRIFSIPAGTMVAGNTYYLREYAGASNFYEMAIVAVGSTATPTITVPASGATLTTPSSTVTWTLSPSTQSNYRVQVRDNSGATVLYDTGEVASSAQTITVPTPDTGVTRLIYVQAKRGPGYAWSPAATRSVTVTHTPPQTPTITSVTPTDSASIGLAHALVIAWNQPAVSGGSPAVTRAEFYVRRNGDTSNGALVATPAASSGAASVTYYGPTHGVTYQVRAKVFSADGRYAFSSWATASGAVTLRGVLLHSVLTPAAPTLFRFNGDEAEDDYQPEAQLIQYDGRELPVVEFGTSSSRALTVTLDMKTDADKNALRAMILARAPMLYRDRRGRKVYAFVKDGGVTDTAYGYRATLTINAVDYPADRAP